MGGTIEIDKDQSEKSYLQLKDASFGSTLTQRCRYSSSEALKGLEKNNGYSKFWSIQIINRRVGLIDKPYHDRMHARWQQ